MGTSFYLSLILGAAIAIGLLRARIRNMERYPKRLPLPPGPKGLPIIGNLLDMPRAEKPWLVFREWSKIYGDIMYLNICGISIIILDSTRRTTDMLGERSSIYSDRPHMPMLIDLMDYGWFFAFMPYGAGWRRHRRLFHKYFHPNAVSKYHPAQSHATRIFLRRLLQSPEDLRGHIRHAFAAAIMKITYGISIKEENDPYVKIAEQTARGVAEAGSPGAFLAADWRTIGYEMAEKPWKLVKSQHSQGMASPSVATGLLDDLPPIGDEQREEEEMYARGTAAIAYAGGADTTVSTVHGFFMAMALYPDVQRKAQAELDSVLGKNRLPEFSDRDSLPYVNAVAKETMRWQNVAPLAFPHLSTSDDEYDGYFIPKGTLIFGNTWSILHDPKIYDQPLEFKPERFLKDGKIDLSIPSAEIAAFGYGRRICPGQYLSDNSLFCTISAVLSVFSVSPALDEHGNPSPIQPEMTTGVISYPVPFRCDIKPRSAAAEKLIWDSQELV
ncbi:cytochrome P450 [Infundibulicybe gibba]|nr:cytochrome P450 [Infundibulicybe gibba]